MALLFSTMIIACWKQFTERGLVKKIASNLSFLSSSDKNKNRKQLKNASLRSLMLRTLGVGEKSNCRLSGRLTRCFGLSRSIQNRAYLCHEHEYVRHFLINLILHLDG